MFKLHWESRKLGAVLLATAGVLAVVYGGTTTEEDGASSKAVDSNSSPGPTAPAVGILLTLAASVLVALYQVLYKKYAALPFDPEFEPALSDGYAHLTPAESLEAALHDPRDPGVDEAMGVYPPPFGLFSNMLTSTIGMTTFGVLWVFIPILHWLGLESFRAPPDSTTALGILGIALTGVIFNAGWMVSQTVLEPTAAIDAHQKLGSFGSLGSHHCFGRKSTPNHLGSGVGSYFWRDRCGYHAMESGRVGCYRRGVLYACLRYASTRVAL